MTPRRAVVGAAAWLVGLAVVIGCNGEFRFDDVLDGGSTLFDASRPSPVDVVDARPPSDPDTSVLPHPALDAAPDTSVAADATAPRAGCHVDGDCKLATLHCDVISGTCVACTTDAQCVALGSRRCDAALHRCIECGLDSDCATGQRCEPSTRRCVTTCTTITGCPATTPFCDLPRSTCIRCHSDVECVVLSGDAHTCDPANGLCVDCIDDGQCKPSVPRCDRTRGKCVQCTGSGDCPATAPLCDPVASACVTG